MNGRSVGMSRELVPLGVVSESNYLYYSSIYYGIRCVCLQVFLVAWCLNCLCAFVLHDVFVVTWCCVFTWCVVIWCFLLTTWGLALCV